MRSHQSRLLFLKLSCYCFLSFVLSHWINCCYCGNSVCLRFVHACLVVCCVNGLDSFVRCRFSLFLSRCFSASESYCVRINLGFFLSSCYCFLSHWINCCYCGNSICLRFVHRLWSLAASMAWIALSAAALACFLAAAFLHLKVVRSHQSRLLFPSLAATASLTVP